MSLIEQTKQHTRHFTVTGYVTNEDYTKILLIYHNKLKKWLPAGGHLEQNEIPHDGAIREVFEETGVQAKVVCSDEPDLSLSGVADIQVPRPYAMTYQLIPSNRNENEHIHIDMIYWLKADEKMETSAQLKEVSDICWMTKQQVLATKETFDSVKGFVKAVLA